MKSKGNMVLTVVHVLLMVSDGSVMKGDTFLLGANLENVVEY